MNTANDSKTVMVCLPRTLSTMARLVPQIAGSGRGPFLTAALMLLVSASAGAQTTTALTDRTWVSMTNGYGPVELNRSNGEKQAGDGAPITLNGTVYAKGLGTHALSEVKYALGGSCSALTGVVGVDDEVGNNGRVSFEVWTDGAKKYDSGVMTGAMAGKPLSLDITGANELTLKVSDGGDWTSYDHADWANLQVTCGSGAPAGGTGTSLTDRVWTSASNGYGPVEVNKSNGENQAGDGRTITLNGVTHARGLGVHATADVRYALGGSCSIFTTVVGIDDEVGGNGSMVFQVWTDGVKKYDSGVMTGAMAGKNVTVDVTGATQLALIATDSGNGSAYDHGDWGTPELTCSSTATPPPTQPSTPPPTGPGPGPASPEGSGPQDWISQVDRSSAVTIWPGDNVQARVNASPAGTAFVFAAGLHRHATIRPRSGDRFYGEAGAVLSGARQLTNFERIGSYWGVRGQTQSGRAHGMCRDGAPRCNLPEQLFIDGQLLQHVGSLGEVGPGKWFFDYGADTIYFSDDPRGRNVETSVTETAFEPSADNVTVWGLVIERYANLAQHGVLNANGRSGWRVIGNDLHWNHGSGVNVGSRSVVRGNLINNNGQIGVGAGGEDVLIAGNVIGGNNTAGFWANWEAGGSKFVGTTRLVVRDNWVHHNGGPGLWSDIDNIETLYEANTVEDNERMGIFHEISASAIIRSNVVRRNGLGFSEYIWGAGILIAGSHDIEIANNLLDGNADGIGIAQQARGWGQYGRNEVRNIWVHDNRTVNTPGWTGLVQDVGDRTVFTSRNIYFDRNEYVTDGGRHFAWMDGERSAHEWRSFGLDPNGYFEP